MKRTIWIFGLVLGLIQCINMIYMVNLCYQNPAFESNDLLGYTVLVILNLLTFFGILNYRNKELGGYIKFGKAFQVGALIVTVASVLYVVVWLFYFYNFVPDWIESYTKHVMIEVERNGATADELKAQQEQMASFANMYENPVFVVLITFAEILPVGLLVALLSALVLQRKMKK